VLAPALEWADAAFLGSLRQQMLRFAMQQLSDSVRAEDAVQEAFVGALQNAKAFGGRSAFKTWVFAILKHKIADSLRHRYRDAERHGAEPGADDAQDLSELFQANGHWEGDERPADWGDPQQALQQGQFWQVLEICLDALPGQQGRVFLMREYIELEPQEICTCLDISVSNLNVMLYRARLRLRECLENRWFCGNGVAA